MEELKSEGRSFEEAQAIAFNAITFLAQDEQRLSRFLDHTGLNEEGVRSQIESRSFQVALLSYLRTDDSLLLVFCSSFAIEPRQIKWAEKVLENGQICGKEEQ